MGFLITQDAEDIDKYTLTAYNDHEASVFVDIGEGLAELLVTNDSIHATEEYTIAEESKLALLVEFMNRMKELAEEGYAMPLLQCGRVKKNSTAEELFVLGHCSPVLRVPMIEFVSAKWWDEPRFEAEVVVRIT
ncbi:MAG: hypothetical protein ACW99G_05070 [Candidatus Thorarchaeota archaeon]|jgi:hypothetical protein